MNNSTLPDFVTQYFWGDDLSQLDLSKNKAYILQVLLERGDQKAIRWVLATIDKQTIQTQLPNLKLSKNLLRCSEIESFSGSVIQFPFNVL